MSATLTRFKVDVTLVAPVLTMASGAIGMGLDAATLRDPMGRPALPGTLVKGNLRHAWEELARITAYIPRQHGKYLVFFHAPET